MIILNKKTGIKTECNNLDVIKTCKKDTNFEVYEENPVEEIPMEEKPKRAKRK